MSELQTKTPWWFWVISILALLWNLMGLMDFIPSVTLNQEYLNQTPGMYEFVESFPVWALAAWGIAIGTSVLGSVCLLLRKSWAFPLFVIALLGMIGSFGYQATSDLRPEVPTWVHIFTAVIWLVAILLIWFSHRMKARGILG